MNLNFCDLCNESIPQADLDLGRAVRRNERLICAACEGAMSGAHVRPVVAPGAVLAPASREPAAGSPIAAVALAFASVALVVGVGIGAYLFWRLEQSTTALAQEIRDLERAAPEPARTVSAALEEEARAREGEAAELRSMLQLLGARVQEIERSGGDHGALERRVDKLDARLATLDDLASRVQHQSGALDRLGTEMSALAARRPVTAESVAPAQTSGPVEPATAPVSATSDTPPWEGWVADLASPVAGTRWQAVQELGKVEDRSVVVHLVPMLVDADIFVRMAACRHLGDLGSIEAVPALIDTLEDEEAAVREAALVALRALSGQSIPFDPLASQSDRSKRVKDWREWWEKAAKDMLARSKDKSKS